MMQENYYCMPGRLRLVHSVMLKISSILLLILACFLSPQITAGALTPDKITPGHVYASVQTMIDEIELLRYEMGGEKDLREPIYVTHVSPQEVYFQALTLFKKANRLSYEQTRATAAEIPGPAGRPLPSDVLRVTRSAMERLRHVKQALGIGEVVAEVHYDSTKKPADVFSAINQANRQLNLLLIQRFNPSDVYQQVTLAIGYSTRLLSLFPARRIQQTPSKVRGKMPKDVFTQLVDSMALIQDIATASNIEILKIKWNAFDVEKVVPSDVYDLAALVVAELDRFHKTEGKLAPPRATYHPGRRLPSDVYQRVKLLNRQLAVLKTQVKLNSRWLTRHSRLRE